MASRCCSLGCRWAALLRRSLLFGRAEKKLSPGRRPAFFSLSFPPFSCTTLLPSMSDEIAYLKNLISQVRWAVGVCSNGTLG